MKNLTPTEKLGQQRLRPIRFAFLVDIDLSPHEMLDAIFSDCYSRWGGRFSLIVPCQSGEIIHEYWPWLELFDPDIVYSYTNLDNSTNLKIQERIAPAAFLNHPSKSNSENSHPDINPTYDFTPLPSTSTVFRLARHSPISHGPRIKIIDFWHTDTPTRFFSDNFGTYSDSLKTGIYPNDAKSVSDLLTVVSEENFHNIHKAVPKDLDRVPSEYIAIKELAKDRAISMSLLSAAFTSRPSMMDPSWSQGFNLVIGETFADRIMFWNARLLMPTYHDLDLCCLRASITDLEDEELLLEVANLINQRNHISNNAYGQPHLIMRSSSHTEEELRAVQEKLQKSGIWSTSGPIHIVPKGHAIPSQNSIDRAQSLNEPPLSLWRSNEWQNFFWRGNRAQPIDQSPEHLKDAPNRQRFTLGLWALSLNFEHEQDGPAYSQKNIWKLPKRWRLSDAFSAEFRDTSFLLNPLPQRTDGQGFLTLFPGTEHTLEAVVVPTVEQALTSALCFTSNQPKKSAKNKPENAERARWLKPSNEAAHLIGVLGMTGGLDNATDLLLRPFFMEMFAQLGGTPNLKDTDTNALVNTLKKRGATKPEFSLKNIDDLQTLATLAIKSAQSIKSPKNHLPLAQLQKQWSTQVDELWSLQSGQNLYLSEEQASTEKDLQKNKLEIKLSNMRERRILFQGFQWSCQSCLHKNWTDFRTLKPTLICDICTEKEDLPINIPWHFRANEFLIEGLRSRSVLSIIWILSALRSRARTSFLYLESSCFGFEENSSTPDAEIDLLAVVDGQTIMCEVKSAWRSLRNTDLKNLIILAKKFRPDIALLAVMSGKPKLEAEIFETKKSLDSLGIKFELITNKEHSITDDFS